METSMLQHMSSDSLSASYLLRSLTSHEHHPHLLLDCSQVEVQCVLFGLEQWGARPFTHCKLPGPLTLPRVRRGTLLIEAPESLSLAQQVALYDWMTPASPGLQIISLTSARLDDLLARGEFLECLYHRLNVVRLDLRAHDAAFAI
jgi:DNA-binding NtrC family response regulator